MSRALSPLVVASRQFTKNLAAITKLYYKQLNSIRDLIEKMKDNVEFENVLREGHSLPEGIKPMMWVSIGDDDVCYFYDPDSKRTDSTGFYKGVARIKSDGEFIVVVRAVSVKDLNFLVMNPTSIFRIFSSAQT